MFHSKNARVPLGMDVPKDVLIINFAGSRFIPSWVVANLKIGGLVPSCIYVRNQVAVLNLGMVNVVQDFAGRAIYSLAYQVGLRNVG